MKNCFFGIGLVLLATVADIRSEELMLVQQLLVAGQCRSKQCLDYDHQQGEGCSFTLSTSALGHAIRLISRLLGELHLIEQDRLLFDEEGQKQIDFNEWCSWVLDLNTFSDVAYHDITQQIKQFPDKKNYLLSELVHYRDKLLLLFEQFLEATEHSHNEYRSAILIILGKMGRKTERMLYRQASAQ